MNQNNKLNTAARRRSRRVIIQLLHQWHIAHDDVSDLLAQFKEEVTGKEADEDYFQLIIQGIFAEMPAIDSMVETHVSRPFAEISIVELAVLRLASYELIHCLDVPYKVIINEALDLNKRYGTTDGHKFVNGVLDTLAKIYRTAETSG